MFARFLGGEGLLADDVELILRKKGGHIGIIALLTGFLLYILTIFLGLSLYTGDLADSLKDKLGIYFYISEQAQTDETTYEQVVELTTKLQDEGLETIFLSKDDAVGFLESRIPQLTETFTKFGIENPLPPTLFVMFRSEEDYQKLKSIIVKYKNIIVNVDDLNEDATLKNQEKRVVTIINFSRFVTGIWIVLVLILFGTILMLGGFMIKSVFDVFHSKIEIKKLLGASHQQIVMPFLAVTFGTIALSVVLLFGLLILTLIVLGISVTVLFDISVWGLLINEWIFFVAVTIAILLVVVLSMGVLSYSYLNHLSR